MALDIVSALVGFMVGVLTGAAGSYLGTRLTERRRTRLAAKDAKRAFLADKATMPSLISKIKVDLAGEGNQHIREFFVLSSKSVHLGRSQKTRFAYYEDEHENLRGKLDILESSGYIVDVTPGNTPIYRISESFVALIGKYA